MVHSIEADADADVVLRPDPFPQVIRDDVLYHIKIFVDMIVMLILIYNRVLGLWNPATSCADNAPGPSFVPTPHPPPTYPTPHRNIAHSGNGTDTG